MVYYLDSGDKFLLVHTAGEVVFTLWSAVKKGPMITSTRWLNYHILNEHMLKVSDYLNSEDEGDKAVGKGILEESLKVTINGNIVGHRE